MNVLMDACSVINLSNAECLDKVAALNNYRMVLPPAVVGECNSGAATEIINLHSDGLIDFIDEDLVPVDRFFYLLDQFSLGAGETECMALAEIGNELICCDDRRARQCASQLLGEHRLMGSLRLLKFGVVEGLFSVPDALKFYDNMINCGGFLPFIDAEFFTDH
jgi:predicted nucleic acid-binding protein